MLAKRRRVRQLAEGNLPNAGFAVGLEIKYGETTCRKKTTQSSQRQQSSYSWGTRQEDTVGSSNHLSLPFLCFVEALMSFGWRKFAVPTDKVCLYEAGSQG